MSAAPATALCRDCARPFAAAAPARCPACGSPRVLDHPELAGLALAHLDCDAFYASVEKRDRPELADRPVIVGGGGRGVVAACCYVARIYGVRSAMPMFKALELCRDAVVLPPDMERYRAAGGEVRRLMRDLTPLVEPLSIDEAFLDLSGTETLHGGPPAATLARLALAVEREVGVTVSIGLSYNKFLAKVASNLDKPRGFAVIGRAEAQGFLAEQPVGIVPGVGRALQQALARDGITRLRHLRGHDEAELTARYGAVGRRLHRFVRGEDERAVEPDAPPKSLSAETTFEADIAEPEALLARLWPLCETVAGRLKRAGLGGRSITLKLKTHDFRTLTRTRRLADPTKLADRIYRAAEGLLRHEADGRRFRLIGVGASDLIDAALADPPDLLDPVRCRRAKAEEAIDRVRDRLGPLAIGKGRGWMSES